MDETPIGKTLWWLWYCFRDEIAEGVPELEDVDRLDALGFMFRVLEWTQKNGRAPTRDEFYEMKRVLLAEVAEGAWVAPGFSSSSLAGKMARKLAQRDE